MTQDPKWHKYTTEPGVKGAKPDMLSKLVSWEGWQSLSPLSNIVT